MYAIRTDLTVYIPHPPTPSSPPQWLSSPAPARTPTDLFRVCFCSFRFVVCFSIFLYKSVFRDEGDKEVVSFYTTCAGSNAFLSALSTAHLQATGASQLLASVDADTFAAACSNEVPRVSGRLQTKIPQYEPCATVARR